MKRSPHMQNRMRRLLLALVALALLLVPQAALAVGEEYQWGDPEKTRIDAKGGAFAQALTFEKTADSPEVVFTATNALLNCEPSGTQPVTATLTLTPAEYAETGGNTGRLTIPSAQANCPPGSSPASLNRTATIAQGSAAATGTAPATAGTTPAAATDECDHGLVSWFTCPIISSISSFIANLMQFVLEPFLQIEPLRMNEDSGLYKSWDNIRNFTNILFIGIFLIIIYSTIFQGGLSNYDVKRILPRMIAAVIFVQMSYFISALIVDFGNILGAGIDSLVYVVTGGGPEVTDPVQQFIINTMATITGFIALALGAAGAAALFVGPGGGLALIGLLITLVLSLLLAALVLSARYLAIAVLIILSPLAFAAWVLPNTANYFKGWWTAFTRLVMMYPIIIFIIAMAGQANELLGQSGEELTTNVVADIAVSLTKIILIIVVFLVIPLTFRWAGAALGRINNIFDDLTKKGVSSYRSSTLAERSRSQRHRKQNEAMNKLMNTKTYKGLNSGGRSGRIAARGMSGAWAAALGGAPTTPDRLRRAYAKDVKAATKELDDIAEARNPMNLTTALQSIYDSDEKARTAARRKLEKEAPSLLPYTTTQVGRAAMANLLADKSSTDNKTVNEIVRNARDQGFLMPTRKLRNEYPLILDELGKERKTKPNILMREKEYNPEYEVKNAAGMLVDYQSPYGSAKRVFKKNDVTGQMEEHLFIERQMGDVDINQVGSRLRNIGAAGLKTDYDAGKNLEVMFPNLKALKDPNASPEAKEKAQRAAKDKYDLFYAHKENLSLRAFEQVLDPGNKNALDVETKLGWTKVFHANADQTKDGRGETLKKTLYQGIKKDEDTIRFTLQNAGMPQYKASTIDPKSQEAKNVIKAFLSGHKYDPSKDYDNPSHDYFKGTP